MTSIRSTLNQLEQETVLNDEEREHVESKPKGMEQNHALLSIIEKKGPKAQQIFYEVLKKVNPLLVEDLMK